MDVNKPEILERGMYKATGQFAVERPVIQQENDVDSPFTDESPQQIPKYLLDLIHEPPSVDPEPESILGSAKELFEEAGVEFIDAEKSAEENPNSRFRVIGTALLPPGVCALCGTSGGDGRQFIDFGKTMDWYGTVYFCTFCIGEASKLLGFAMAKDYELALKNLRDELSDSDDRYVEAKVKLDAAMVLLRNCSCSDSGIGSPVVEIPEADIVEPGDAVEPDESTDQVEPDADEPVVEQGPNDVSGSSGNDESVPDVKPTRRVRKSS